MYDVVVSEVEMEAQQTLGLHLIINHTCGYTELLRTKLVPTHTPWACWAASAVATSSRTIQPHKYATCKRGFSLFLIHEFYAMAVDGPRNRCLNFALLHLPIHKWEEGVCKFGECSMQCHNLNDIYLFVNGCEKIMKWMFRCREKWPLDKVMKITSSCGRHDARTNHSILNAK